MSAQSSKRRAAIEAPPAEAETTPQPAPRLGLIAELDAAIRAAQARGDHAAHAALTELHVACGLLRAKAATRANELAGADADLAQKIHSLL